ncbi:ArsR family transcriptional regulator [Fictibacillus sp. KIGAM418]|uniref:ArsR family transcriptional regulator n=1 Tax=Fictibacillus marinisediminis TaxID=2878389 RepID=A0A9X2BGD0_9BACL|nr:ArsR family transcriptional regulator [Fictibacillus marinisediminis]MCK6256393.1 ArsR family transcriptional regulator [Fictibacillus marinisediminis]
MKHLLSAQPAEKVQVALESSCVWEVILGIAGYTYAQLRHSFDLDEQWKDWKGEMNSSLIDHLKQIQETNLWYGMLLLQNRWNADTLQEFSNKLQNMTEEEFYETLLPYKNREAEATRKENALNFSHENRFREYAAYFEGHEYLEGYVRLLGERPRVELSSLMLSAMEEWHGFISAKPVWEKWMQSLAHETRQTMKFEEPLEEIERITGGLKYIPEPSVWYIKLVPHVSYRPWVLQLRTPDTMLFFYPVNEEYFTEPGVPSMDLIRGHKALGDEFRLKLLFQLQKGPLSLQELSGQFHMSKTTLHHQLSLLKAAKFVSVEKGIYSANVKQIQSFSERLIQYLGKEG